MSNTPNTEPAAPSYEEMVKVIRALPRPTHRRHIANIVEYEADFKDCLDTLRQAGEATWDERLHLLDWFADALTLARRKQHYPIGLHEVGLLEADLIEAAEISAFDYMVGLQIASEKELTRIKLALASM